MIKKKPKVALPKLKNKGSLTKFGYALNKPKSEREKALEKAVKAGNPITIIRRINYLRIVNKNNEAKFKKYTQDMRFVQKLKGKIENNTSKNLVKKLQNAKKQTGKKEKKVTFQLRKNRIRTIS